MPYARSAFQGFPYDRAVRDRWVVLTITATLATVVWPGAVAAGVRQDTGATIVLSTARGAPGDVISITGTCSQGAAIRVRFYLYAGQPGSPYAFHSGPIAVGPNGAYTAKARVPRDAINGSYAAQVSCGALDVLQGFASAPFVVSGGATPTSSPPPTPPPTLSLKVHSATPTVPTPGPAAAAQATAALSRFTG